MEQHTKKRVEVNYKLYNEQYRKPEQELAETLLLKHKHFILGFEPGKGKSYPVIHAVLEVQKLKARPISVLIMSDATCIRDMWKAEIMPQGILPKDTYFVTDRTAIGNVKLALLSKRWDVIIVDECQSLRSGITRTKSQFAKLVHKLTSQTEYVFGMTGTLSGNNNMEPWCVLHNLNVAGMGKISPRDFRKTCCVEELSYGPFGNFYKPVRLNPTGEALLNKAYENGVMFWPYDDNDDMPLLDITTKVFPVVNTVEYQNALRGILKLDEHENTVIKATAIQKAQQALNGFLYWDEGSGRQTYKLSSYDNPKLNFVLEMCKNEPTIVGFRFQEDGASIERVLTQNNIKWTTDIQEFRTDLSIQVLVLQCSRGKSANIQRCQNIIYYTSDFSFISYKQFIHRTWRTGQTEPCKVTFLVNEPVIGERNEVIVDKHKVESRIWESLRQKQSIHDMLMSIKQAEGDI